MVNRILDMAPGVVLRLLLFGLLWWLLTEGDTSRLRYAVVVVPLAVAASVATLPPRPPRPSRWARRIAAAVGLGDARGQRFADHPHEPSRRCAC